MVVNQGVSDITLFNRIRNNDRLALNTLFVQYYRPLCLFAFSYLQSEGEAEECVSDVFFNLWRTRANVTIDKSLKAYLYASVRHASIASIKKRKMVFEEIDELTESTIPDTITPLVLLDLKELENEIEKAVHNLPDRCRRIFIMSRYDGLKYREIGEILSISEKTVENQLIKALGMVRTYLKENSVNTKFIHP